jgi:hypothetical protein
VLTKKYWFAATQYSITSLLTWILVFATLLIPQIPSSVTFSLPYIGLIITWIYRKQKYQQKKRLKFSIFAKIPATIAALGIALLPYITIFAAIPYLYKINKEN